MSSFLFFFSAFLFSVVFSSSVHMWVFVGLSPILSLVGLHETRVLILRLNELSLLKDLLITVARRSCSVRSLRFCFLTNFFLQRHLKVCETLFFYPLIFFSRRRRYTLVAFIPSVLVTGRSGERSCNSD